MNRCRICNNEKDNKIYIIREMLFGLRESFEYIKCNSCGCLQIKEYPKNISKYYPDNYSAYRKESKISDNKFIFYLRHKKLKYCLNNEFSIIGFLLGKSLGCGFEKRLKPAKVDYDSKILDVGTGVGNRLILLRKKGFNNLTGTDIFIKEDIFYPNGVKVFKKDIKEIDEKYDFIMLNHSLEHMPNQLDVLKQLYRILKPEKYILIRIPVVSSFAWQKYNVNWVGIDAPRHYYLHTLKSMEILVNRAGFLLREIKHDSTEFQFVGSEQYIKNIPLRSERSYYENPKDSIFSSNDIRRFQKKAKKLNKEKRGDMACFYLYKSGSGG